MFMKIIKPGLHYLRKKAEELLDHSCLQLSWLVSRVESQLQFWFSSSTQADLCLCPGLLLSIGCTNGLDESPKG